MLLPLAETIPAVTVEFKPSGFPTARTHCPTSTKSELVKLRYGNPFSSIFNSAISVLGSEPTRFAT